MRFASVGMVAVVVVVAAGLNAWAQPGQGIAPAPMPAAVPVAGAVGTGNGAPTNTSSATLQKDEQSGLIALSTSAGDKLQQVTVIDPRTMVMTVYHIEVATGTIHLKSARKIEYDLQMVQFNGTSPLPQDIRNKIEQLR